MFFGIPDFWISLVYLLCIGSTILCVVYGLVNWNKGLDTEDEEISEGQTWAEEEKHVEEKL